MNIKKKIFMILIIIIPVVIVLSNISKISTNATMESFIKPPISEKTENYKAVSSSAPNSNNSNNSQTSSKNLLEQAYYDYEGLMGKQMYIHMSFYAKDGMVKGTYFYDRYGEEISITGNTDWREITLYEYDKKGHKLGSFQGILDSNNKIKGNWKDISGENSYPFYLELKDIVYGSQEKRYSAAIQNKSDAEVEAFAANIKNYVQNGDAEHLSENICYPISICNHDGKTIINDKQEFINKYNSILSDEYKTAINKAFAKYMFANSKGIMLGSSYYNMWINDVKREDGSYALEITSINN